MSQWIKVTDRLPPQNKYVLGIHTMGTWRDSNDQEHVNYVIIKLIKGLSEEERQRMPDNNPRKKTYRSEDEWGNNLVPYYFDTFGPTSFFGQDISHWQPLPEPPVD